MTSQAFSDFYMAEPDAWTGYIEDRLDLGDVVLVAGLRYDYYNSNSSHPEYCDSLGACSPTVRISSNPLYDPNNPEASLEEIYVENESHDYISPHIQVSFPVSDRTNMRFSYAHQVQPPDFALVLGGINTDLAVTNTNHVYGSDLDFGKTITFEFGIRHAFSDDFVLDFSAYNRDAQSNQAARLLSLYDPLKLQNQDIRMMTNADYGNYRGFDIRLDKRIGSLFNGTLAYSFSDAKNTGSDPFTYINFGSRIVNQISGGNDPPPSAYLPTTYTRPHNLAGSFSVTFPNGWNSGSTTGAILQNVGIFATFRVASGTAYTRCPVETGNESVLSTECLRPAVRGRRQRLAPPDLPERRPPPHQGLPVRRRGPHGVPGRAERLQLHQHDHGRSPRTTASRTRSSSRKPGPATRRATPTRPSPRTATTARTATCSCRPRAPAATG